MMKRGYRLISVISCMAFTLTLTSGAGGDAFAAAKIKLKPAKATISPKKTVTVKIKGITKKKIKKTTWTIENTKIATRVSSTKLSIKLKAKKAGKTKVIAKVKRKKGSLKKLVFKLTVKSDTKQTNTKEPDMTSTPDSTPEATTKTPEQTLHTLDPAIEKPDSIPDVTPNPTYSAKPVEAEISDDILTFSKAGGAYADAFDLTLSAPDGYTIYYTTDGSEPTTESTKYTSAILVKNRDKEDNIVCSDENVKKSYIPGTDYAYTPTVAVPKCTIIRAKAVSDDGTESRVITKSYFIGKSIKDEYGSVAVISVVTDPDNLFDYDKGIHVLGKYYDEWKDTTEGKGIIGARQFWNYVANYSQKGKAWERPISFELFDGTDEKTLTYDAGIRLHGGASRMYGQRSFNIYFKKDYNPDQKRLKYPLFEDQMNHITGDVVDSYKSFALRNGGNDCEYTKFYDVLFQECVKDRAFDTQSSRLAVLYLNGEYWGFYNLTEKYSDQSIEEEYGVDADNVVVFKEDELDEGDEAKGDVALYEDLMSYADKDLSDDNIYKEFCEKVDIRSLLDYYATEIYVGNQDWLITGEGIRKNYQLWRARDVEEGNPYADGKWRYMIYDLEQNLILYNAGDANTDTFKQAVSKDPLFASLVKNYTFRELFFDTLKDIGENNFGYKDVKKRIDYYSSTYKPYFKDYYERFGSYSAWAYNMKVQAIDDFFKARYDALLPKVEKDLEKYR